MEGYYIKPNKKASGVLSLSVLAVTLTQKAILASLEKSGIIVYSEDYVWKFLAIICSAVILYFIVAIFLDFNSIIDGMNFMKKLADLRLVINLILIIPSSQRYFVVTSGEMTSNLTAFLGIIYVIVAVYVVERVFVSPAVMVLTRKIPFKTIDASNELYFDAVFLFLSKFQSAFIAVTISLFAIITVLMVLLGYGYGTINTFAAFVNTMIDYVYFVLAYPFL